MSLIQTLKKAKCIEREFKAAEQSIAKGVPVTKTP